MTEPSALVVGATAHNDPVTNGVLGWNLPSQTWLPRRHIVEATPGPKQPPRASAPRTRLGQNGVNCWAVTTVLPPVSHLTQDDAEDSSARSWIDREPRRCAAKSTRNPEGRRS